MKRLLITSLSVIALSTLVLPALADEIAAVRSNSTDNILKITPIDLVSGSYQGRFTKHGLPSGAAFVSSIRTNKIQAKDLVKVAIAEGRLPEDSINDRSYLNAVEFTLDGLDKN